VFGSFFTAKNMKELEYHIGPEHEIQILEITQEHSVVESHLYTGDFTKKRDERRDRAACKLISIVGGRIASGLTKLGVGPLNAIRIEQEHIKAISDPTLKDDVRIRALDVNFGIQEGVFYTRRHGLKPQLIPVREEIEVYNETIKK
jgi:hypothetical protein